MKCQSIFSGKYVISDSFSNAEPYLGLRCPTLETYSCVAFQDIPTNVIAVQSYKMFQTLDISPGQIHEEMFFLTAVFI